MEKTISSILGLMILCTVLFSCKVHVETHSHTFSEEWSFDEDYHWHKATCEHKDEVFSESHHRFNDWNVILDSTEEAEGSMEKICSVCAYKVIEVISKKEHVHTIVTEWSSNAENHWHAASCGKEEHVEDVAGHTWNHEDYQYDSVSRKEIRSCTVCSYVDEKEHVHTIATEWSSNAEKHWHAVSCGKEEHNEDVAGHTWDHEDYQNDSVSRKEIRSCTVCSYVDEKKHIHTIATEWSSNTEKHWHVASCGKEDHNEDVAEHTEDSGTTTTVPTCVTKGVKTYKCTGCDIVLRTEEISESFSSPVDVTTGNAATASSIYIYFGVFPKTVKSSSVTIDVADTVTMGANIYYKGSDDEWYVKITANPYESSYKYSDNTTVSKVVTYFKVEPIKWKVLTSDYNGTGNALLLAEDLLTANVPYYVSRLERTIGGNTVYANNYKYSTIRAYLNGKYEDDDTQSKTDYTDKGFLQTAFTTGAQALIAETTVVNDGTSTSDAAGNLIKADGSGSGYPTNFTCTNTTDKILLLSEQEVTATAYGFKEYDSSGKGNTRIRVTTDYAKANYACQNTTSGYGGYWWLRSPAYNLYSRARLVGVDGLAYNDFYVYYTEYGVVPALSISLQ